MANPTSPTTVQRLRRLMGMPAIPPPPGRITAMLAARRRIIDNVVSSSDAVLRPRSNEMAMEMDKASVAFPKLTNWEVAAIAARGEADRVLKSIAGSYWVPNYETPYRGIVTYQPGDRMVRRHELMHAYTHAAEGGVPGMPLWSRVAASAPQSLRYPLDELLAQRAGGTPFMEIPWDRYAISYARMGNPGAARVARVLQAAQIAARHPSLAGAATVGGGGLLYGLTAEDLPRDEDGNILVVKRGTITGKP